LIRGGGRKSGEVVGCRAKVRVQGAISLITVRWGRASGQTPRLHGEKAGDFSAPGKIGRTDGGVHDPVGGLGGALVIGGWPPVQFPPAAPSFEGRNLGRERQEKRKTGWGGGEEGRKPQGKRVKKTHARKRESDVPSARRGMRK